MNIHSFKRKGDETLTHPRIQSDTSRHSSFYKYNTDAIYTRHIEHCQCLKIKAVYILLVSAELLLFLAACIFYQSTFLQTLTILLQAAMLIAFLLLFMYLITYLFSSNTLKEYEYRAAIRFYQIHAFLWLCSIIYAIGILFSLFISFQMYSLSAVICILIVCCIAYVLYSIEMKIPYTKDA